MGGRAVLPLEELKLIAELTWDTKVIFYPPEFLGVLC